MAPFEWCFFAVLYIGELATGQCPICYRIDFLPSHLLLRCVDQVCFAENPAISDVATAGEQWQVTRSKVQCVTFNRTPQRLKTKPWQKNPCLTGTFCFHWLQAGPFHGQETLFRVWWLLICILMKLFLRKNGVPVYSSCKHYCIRWKNASGFSTMKQHSLAPKMYCTVETQVAKSGIGNH